MLFFVACFACCEKHEAVRRYDGFQQARVHYDSGFVMLQQDSLLAAFPHFIRVAEKLEVLPEDMTDEEILLVSRPICSLCASGIAMF